MEALNLAILGLCAGALIGLSAQGVVLIYRGSGVLNLAHAAVGSTSAFIYWELAERLGLPFILAVAGATGAAAVLGLLIYMLVIQPLFGASTLTKLVATLAVLVVIQAALQLIYGPDQRFISNPLPNTAVEAGQLRLPVDRLILLSVAILATIAVSAVYRHTKFGLATSATAENPRGAAALGMSVRAVGAANWVAGAALAGFASALMSPILHVQLASRVNLIVPILAAALLGGMRSFGLTLAGGVVMGIAQAMIGRYVETPGWSDAVPLVVIIAVMVTRSRGIQSRPQPSEIWPRTGRGTIRPVLVASAFGTVFILVNWVFPVEYIDATTLTLSVGLILLSSVVITGYAGQLSLAQFAFAGIGAVAAGRLVSEAGLSFLMALMCSVLIVFPIAFLVGLPALRTRGTNFAITTLGIAAAFQGVVFANTTYTGGDYVTVPPPTVFGVEINNFLHPQRYATVALVVLVVSSLAVANLRRSQTGRRLLAVRSNERAATAMGINVYGAKLYAFALAGSIAALGGVLLTFRQTSLSYTGQFAPMHAINGILYSVVGGIGTVLGPVLGSLGQPASIISTVFHGQGDTFAHWLSLILGLGTIKLVQDAPDGLVGLVTKHVGPRIFRRSQPTGRLLVGTTEANVRVPGSVLEVSGLTVRYGGVTALTDFACTVRPGAIHGVIGPNGAGKTSLVDALTGYVTPTRGSVLMGGEPLLRLNAHARARAGLSRTFQSLELFDDLTVRENLLLAAGPQRLISYARDLVLPGRSILSPSATAAIREFGLDSDLDRFPNELSYGRRRLVAIARGVAAGPSILCLDEPAAGLSEVERLELRLLLRRLADEWGIGVILIEHDVEMVMNVCDYVTAVEFGTIIACGTPSQVRADPAVVAAYLGVEEEEIVRDPGRILGGDVK